MSPEQQDPTGTTARRGPSLRRRLVLLALSFAVPASALQGYLAWRAFSTVHANAVQETRASIEAIAAATLSTLEAAETMTSGFAALGPTELLDPERCDALVGVTLGLTSSFAGLSVVDADGELVCSALPIPVPRPTAADRQWFRQLKATGRLTVSEPIMGRVTRVPVIVMAAPIFDTQGAVVGSVSGGMELDQLARVAGTFLVAAGGIATITDRDGVVLTRTRELERYAGQSLPSLSYPTLAEGAGWQVVRGQDLEGVDRFFGRVDLARYGWRIYAGLTSDDLLAAGYREARDMLFTGLIFLVLAMAVAVWAYRAVTAPLDALISDIDAIASGGVKPVRANTRELGTVATAINKMLSARSAAEERHRDFLANAPFGVYTTTADGELLEANPTLVRMLGYDSLEELRQVQALEVYADPGQRSALVREVTERGEFSGLEVVWVRKDGNEIEVRLSGRAVETSAGWHFEGIVEDVTEHRRLEELYRHQQKTEAVSRLAGGVAHEINNALTVIGGYADILAMTATDGETAEDVRMINDGVRRAAEMTRSLLAISRRDTARAASLDPAEVVAELHAVLRRVLPADIDLDVTVDGSVGRIWMNRGHLVQVLLNLGVNARDAMPDGGCLTITCASVEEAHDPLPWIAIRIRDSGQGISPDVLPRIFEPFFTTKPSGAGTGLGLATALGLVEQAGGRIVVESTKGEGTCFTVLLPTSDRTDEDSEQEQAAAVRGGGERVLVIEDDAPLRELVARVLLDAGYRVEQAGRADEARRVVSASRESFDLVIADLVLPDGQGSTLLREFVPSRAAHGICISGYPDRIVSQAVDGVDYLLKPFKVEELLLRVRTALDVTS